MRDVFSTLEICKALNIQRETLRDWMNRGFIKPSTPAKGQGTRATFSRKGVYLVELFRHMLGIGFSRKTADGLMAYIEDKVKKGSLPDFITFFLSLDSPGIMGTIDEVDFDRVFQTQRDHEEGTWSDIIIVNFRRIRKKVDAAIQEKLGR